MQSVSTQKNLMPIKFTGKLTNDEIQQGFSRPVWQVGLCSWKAGYWQLTEVFYL